MNHYQLLGVAHNANTDQIGRAYINLCKRYKSTLNYGPDISFEAVHEAYKTLTDAESRRRYDDLLIREDTKVQKNTVTVASSGEPAAEDEWASKDYSGIKEWVYDFRVPANPIFASPVVDTHSAPAPRVTTSRQPSPVVPVRTSSSGRKFFIGLLIFLAFTGIPAGAAFWSSTGMNGAAATSYSLLFACLFSIACLKTRPKKAVPVSKNFQQGWDYSYPTSQRRKNSEPANKKWRYSSSAHEKWNRPSPAQKVYQDLTPAARRNLMDGNFALKYKIWGMPGILDDAVEKFGQRNIDLGTAGEELTAKMLEDLLKIPGTRIFHGLKFPGSQTADVDHAIINGDKIVFIDSKMWIGAHYKWIRPDTIGRVRRKEFKEVHTNFPAAVGYLSQTFSKQQVMAMTIIHSNNNYRVSVDNSHASTVILSNGPDAVQTIGNWFSKDLTGKIDLNSMQKLEYQLKK